jgi:hypothetical protein
MLGSTLQTPPATSPKWIQHTVAYVASSTTQTAQNRRKKVEMLFAHLKRILGLARLRLRGPYGVQDEFTLAAIAQNLRKLAKLKPLVPATG